MFTTFASFEKSFVCTQFKWSNSSIGPIDKALSSAITQGQNELESNANEGVLHILKSSSITEASLSDGSVSYPGHSLEEFYPSAENFPNLGKFLD